MAQIRIHEVNTRIENEVEVSKFLQEEGVFMRNGIFLNFLLI